MEDLTTLCQNELIRNPKLIDNLSNVPYRLVKRVFEVIRIKVDQLLKIERSNVFYIFENDAIWLGLLKSEFPGNVHDSFISDGSLIREYYLREFSPVMETLSPLEKERFKLCLHEKLRRDPDSGKYRIPYRMLYFQYQEDAKRREAESAEKLRLTVQKINKEREKKQTVVVDYSSILKNRRYGSRKRVALSSWGPISSNPASRLASSQLKEKKKMTTMMKRPVRLAFGGAAGGSLSQNDRICCNDSVVPGNGTEREHEHEHEHEHDHDHSDSPSPTLGPQLQQVTHTTRIPPTRRHTANQSIFLSTTKKRLPPIPRAHRSVTPDSVGHATNRDNTAFAQSHVGTKKKRSSIFTRSEDKPTPVIRVHTKVRASSGSQVSDTDRTPSGSPIETVAAAQMRSEVNRISQGDHTNSTLNVPRETGDGPSQKRRRVTSLKNYLTRHQK